RAARTLHRALAGKTVTGFRSMLPKLNRVDEDSPVVGRTIESVESRGKWLLFTFSGDLLLLTHMLMNGSWHIYRQGERWQRSASQMRIVLETNDFVAVGFSVPVAEFHDSHSLARREGFSSLGQDVLSPEFDEGAAKAALLARPETEVGVALLTQSLLAGIGNVFKSEICFACHVHPARNISSLTEGELQCLVRTARKQLASNVTPAAGDAIVTYTGMRRTTGRSDPAARVWVYGRRGDPCRRCGTAIEAFKQQPGARTTFFCPKCQTR
ncbi:MAG TPA: DNA-formamidopyrimidine glycosylase family protein, partial [Terriglobales bacterium]